MVSESQTALAVVNRGVRPTTVGEMMEIAKTVSESQLAPKGMNSPSQIFVAIQTGMEVGLTPMQSLRSIVVINGNPSWRGDAALSLVMSSGKMADYSFGFEGETGKEDRAAFVKSRRLDQNHEYKTIFTVAQAKRAGLWAKQGPWTQYPDRMMHYRALGFHLRDYYPDVLNGLAVAEEVIDYADAPKGQFVPTAAPKDALLDLATGQESTAAAPDPAPDPLGEPDMDLLRGEGAMGPNEGP